MLTGALNWLSNLSLSTWNFDDSRGLSVAMIQQRTELFGLDDLNCRMVEASCSSAS
jgi:hypothetical protein